MSNLELFALGVVCLTKILVLKGPFEMSKTKRGRIWLGACAYKLGIGEWSQKNGKLFALQTFYCVHMKNYSKCHMNLL